MARLLDLTDRLGRKVGDCTRGVYLFTDYDGEAAQLTTSAWVLASIEDAAGGDRRSWQDLDQGGGSIDDAGDGGGEFRFSPSLPLFSPNPPKG